MEKKQVKIEKEGLASTMSTHVAAIMALRPNNLAIESLVVNANGQTNLDTALARIGPTTQEAASRLMSRTV
jgi:hypothetical protein